MEDELKALIEEILNIPCKLESESIVYPSATIEAYMESPELFGDGQCIAETGSIAINLWYHDRNARNEDVSKLKKALPEAGYTAPTVQKYFDTTARVHRAVLTTEKILKEE